MFGEYEDDDDYYEDDYDTAAPAPAPVRENYGLRDARETEYSAPAPRKAASKNAANPQIYSVNTSVQMQVVIIKLNVTRMHRKSVTRLKPNVLL